ncbi:hypothetical protein [Streptomyces wuyuanensis]|uniref:hypothetical protein n=1 Tax=Streptomyces wuyuanensis TaxID=1196353 RepID=UPI0034463843
MSRITDDLYAGFTDSIVTGTPYGRYDTNSGDVVLAVEENLRRKGLNPFTVVSGVSRHWVDMNRDPRSAYRHFRSTDADGDPVDTADGIKAWSQFHDTVEQYCRDAKELNRKVLILDIHGKKGRDVHRGTYEGEAVADEHKKALAENFLDSIRTGFVKNREKYRVEEDEKVSVLPEVEFTPTFGSFLDYEASETDARGKTYKGGFNTEHFSVYGKPAYDYYTSGPWPVWFERKADGSGRLVTFPNTYFLSVSNPPKDRVPEVVEGGEQVKSTGETGHGKMEVLEVDSKLTSLAGSELYVDSSELGAATNASLSDKVLSALKDPVPGVEYQPVFAGQASACNADVVQLELGSPYRGSYEKLSDDEEKQAIDTTGSVIAAAVAQYHQTVQDDRAVPDKPESSPDTGKPEPEASESDTPQPTPPGSASNSPTGPTAAATAEPNTRPHPTTADGSLAKTGARVLSVTLVALAAIGTGFLIVWYRRRGRTN